MFALPTAVLLIGVAILIKAAYEKDRGLSIFGVVVIILSLAFLVGCNMFASQFKSLM